MKRRRFALRVLTVLAATVSAVQAVAAPPSFARLSPLPSPKIVAAAEAFPGNRYKAPALLDGKPSTEYASNGKGTETFVEFDFGQAVRIAGFRHQDRNDPATIAASKLVLSDSAGKPLATVPVKHVNQRAGVTWMALPEPVTAQRVRWQVTRLGNKARAVGGAEITFFTAGEPEDAPHGIGIEARALPIVERQAQGETQPLEISLDYPYATPIDAVVRVEGQEAKPLHLKFGNFLLQYTTAVLAAQRPLPISIECAGQSLAARTVTLKPARKTTIYLLAHSHTDIGYTEIQTDIEDKQVNNLRQGMEYARKTADYPPGARFVWNVEVLWAADLYLRRLDDRQRAEFLEAVKKGQVALNGMYLNELTGLCRPEELLRLFRFATQLRQRTGAALDAAMISDVPGYTWGTVTAMAQAGIKYFSVAPNYFDRIGDILVQWENKPFYWLGPSAKDKVLVWVPYQGYGLSHRVHALTPEFVKHYQQQLDETAYPYDITYLRWAGRGDNAVPDPAICDFVKDWNAQYVWPKFIIASTSEAFAALEKRYGPQIPQVRGDWTPYWEDGAGSSALETATNRASSDRLVQAEAVWAMRGPQSYPAADFERAWRDVLLYSEHTWGASCSVTDPLRKEAREQWAVKQSYATAADLQSRDLLSRALSLGPGVADDSGETGRGTSRRQISSPPTRLGAEPVPSSFTDGDAVIDVVNTNSWPRTDLVVVPKYLAARRTRVVDERGAPVPSQRLRSGELALLARDVPPFAARRYTLQEGAPYAEGHAVAKGPLLENDRLRIRLDERSGGIAELRAAGGDANLADTASGERLNDYLYLVGDNLADLQRSGPVKITVKESGPLVTSLLVESDAPGCYNLRREVRLVAGLDYVELINVVDKRRIVSSSYLAKEGKESVNFAFPFHVPGGQLRLEVPFGVLRPDVDQIASACKNWFTAGRWADVANNDFGVTWVTLDAPLVEVGGITATLLNSQTDPAVWRKKVEPTQKLYSWAMNNHWGTNYRAFQEGPVEFRFVVRPHRRYDPAAASRLAIGLSEPLLATAARGAQPAGTPLLTLDSPEVLVIGLKPSDDGKAIMVRLWGAGGRDLQTRVAWSQDGPRRFWLSDLSEKPLTRLEGAVSVPAWGVVTLRAE